MKLHNIKILVVIAIPVLLSACATQQPIVSQVDPLRENPRVVFRDLTVPPQTQIQHGIYSSRTKSIKSFSSVKKRVKYKSGYKASFQSIKGSQKPITAKNIVRQAKQGVYRKTIKTSNIFTVPAAVKTPVTSSKKSLNIVPPITGSNLNNAAQQTINKSKKLGNSIPSAEASITKISPIPQIKDNTLPSNDISANVKLKTQDALQAKQHTGQSIDGINKSTPVKVKYNNGKSSPDKTNASNNKPKKQKKSFWRRIL